MTHISTLTTIIADVDVTLGGIIAVLIILAIIVLAISLWLFRLSRRPRLRRCPYCDVVIQVGTNFCPNCGKEVPPEPKLVK
ncbi:MAG: hypothetical protein M3Z24_06420 [Chloroflexota bacterium]|nr:hypothetical protein [Chloroflexota bacterium]